MMSSFSRLTVALLLVVAATAGCDEDLINPMAHRQEKVGSYSPSDFYQDGMAMRAPPAGTVPRQRITGLPGATTGKDGDNYVTSFPIRVDEQLVRLGQRRYNIICGTCHGPLGDGDSIVGRQMALRPPPSLMLYQDRPIGYIFEVATKGHGLMASYAAELPVRERWAVVAYVKALQTARSAPLDRAPVAERSRLEKESP
jgi:mono/diheme cytochrome c family protein